MADTRPPVFAEQGWYPNDPTRLQALLDQMIISSPEHPPKRRFGVISPHAGYRYSGHVAGALFAQVEVPDQVVILTVNHRGMGRPAAVWNRGAWAIPGADVPIDEELADALIGGCLSLEADPSAHLAEHSGELQVPFLHHRNPRIRIVPIALRHLRCDDAITLGKEIHRVLDQVAPDALIVASSDMNHFEADEISREKDAKAIEKALALDPRGLYETVANLDISMCGVVPATVMLSAANESGVHRAELVRYANSGEITGDQSSVVGYAGLTFDRS